MALGLAPEQLLAGKLLAAWSVLALAIAGTLGIPIALHALGGLEAGVVVAGYAGLLLLALSYAAVGLLASSLSQSAIAAYLLGLLGCLSLWLADKIGALVPPGVGRAVAALGSDHHFQNIAKGVLDPLDLAFYPALVLGALALAALRLRLLRWPQ